MPIEKSEKHKTDNNKRILVAGDVLGQFTKFYKRLQTVNEKAGPFHYVLCVGNFFSIEDENSEDPNLVYIAKEFKDAVPMPLYVLGPCFESQRRFYKPLFKDDLRGTPSFEEGFDIASNVTYVGKKGVLTTIDELKIGYLSGLETTTGKCSDYTFGDTDIQELIEVCSSSRVDILMTTNFPYNVNEFSFGGKTAYLHNLCENGSMLVAKLAKSVLPRYHFAPSEGEFFEREPYRNHQVMQEQPKMVTRFVSVAAVGKAKQKWLYAFNIVPARWLTREELNKQPDDATENPYASLTFEADRGGANNSGSNNGGGNNSGRQPDNGQFFFQTPTHHNNRYQQQQSRYPPNNSRYESGASSSKRPMNDANEEDKRPKLGENSCWFCLSSAQVEKHLIISIGDKAYLALAKGNLVEHHFLILPIGHYRSINEIESNPDLDEVYNEIGRFKNALIDFMRSEGKVALFYERNYKSGHLQLQCIGVPHEQAENVEPVLKRVCKERSFSYNEVPMGVRLRSQIASKVPYFYMEIQGRRYFIGIKPSRGFPMQFGRELLADPQVLNCPARIDWRNCELDEEAAKQLVERLRKDFEPFDFTV